MKQGNPQQGHEEEQRQFRRARRAKIDEAFTAMETLMHEMEGSQSGSYSSREMAIAGTHLQTAWLWAREAIEE